MQELEVEINAQFDVRHSGFHGRPPETNVGRELRMILLSISMLAWKVSRRSRVQSLRIQFSAPYSIR